MSSHTPGPWAVGYRAIDVVCVNAKCGGTAKLFDVRGWGYLTGTGHGGLGLSDDEAYEIQKANARLAAAAPDLLAAASKLIAAFDELKSTTTAERIITGRSDADLRKASNEAIAELRAAISSASEPRP